MARTQLVGNQLANGIIVNSHIASNAAIATSKFADSAKFVLSDSIPAFTVDVSLNSHKITNLADGSATNDAVNKGQLDAIASSLTNALQYKGTWDLGAGTIGPSTYSQGDFYIVAGITPGSSGEGVTINGVEYTNGDNLIALADGTVTNITTSNWSKVDNTDLVSSVCGYRGAVTLGISDINSLTTALSDKLDDSQLIDDDTMATATATNIPSAESVKAYVDNRISETITNEIPSGTIDGTNSTFTLVSTPNPTASLQVYHQGLRLKVTDDYTLNGNTITMGYFPETSSWLLVDYNK
jgi:hypothetical protein